MGSTYKGADLFGSGPHRFAAGPEGTHMASNTEITGTPTAGSQDIGALEPEVVVTGRLVASTDAGLWSLRDAIAAAAESGETPGDLVDQHGRTWGGMRLITFAPRGATARGRVVSVGYEARFRRMPVQP
jgi:hypothetical protein